MHQQNIKFVIDLLEILAYMCGQSSKVGVLLFANDLVSIGGKSGETSPK